MNKTSSVVTGSATVAAAAIAPFVEWVANVVCKWAMPPQVVLIVAAALVTTCHFCVNLINTKRPEPSKAAPTSITREGGFAHLRIMLAMAALSFAVLAMQGCSLMSPTIDKVEAGAMQSVVQSSERTICRDLPVGAWMAYYGTNSDRVKGWQALCFNPIKAPLNDATVAAILKVYPGFQQAEDAAAGVPPVQAAQAAAPAVVTIEPAPIPAAVVAPVKVRRAPKPKPIAVPQVAVVAAPAPLAVVPAAVAPPAQTSLLSAPVVHP